MQLSDLVYIDSTGYHFADYPSFLQWRTDQYRSIYGNDVYLEPDSQDGQLLAVQAKADYDTAAQGAATFNAFSPVTAQGVGLSRVVKINGLNRQVPSNSTSDLTIVGQASTVIKNGVAIDILNQKWNLPATVTIPGGGTIVVTATAATVGAVQAAANTINSIFTPTLGWQTVNNAADATPGAPVETDAHLRVRQAASTANPSKTVFDGTWGALENVPGVEQVRGYENPTNSTDANSIPAHSFTFMVIGGDAMVIAQTIAIHKGPGSDPVGTTSEIVYDERGMPLTIGFTRPTKAEIHVEITLAAGVGWTTDYETQIKNAVAAVIGSQALGVAGFGIGNTVLINRLFAPANLTGTPPSSTFNVSLIRLKKNAGSFGTTNIAISFNEYPDCDPAIDFTFIVT